MPAGDLGCCSAGPVCAVGGTALRKVTPLGGLMPLDSNSCRAVCDMPLDFATALALLTLGCGMWRIWHAWVRQLLMLNVERLDEIAWVAQARGSLLSVRSGHDHG